MSPLKEVVGVAPGKYIGLAFEAGQFSGNAASEIRHELVEAQVDVLRMYLEKQSRERLLAAVDRLIECTETSFRNEEALLECLKGGPEPLHREAHRGILAQLASLRARAMDFDRGRLLAHLILVDRELTSHISDAADVLDCKQQQEPADCESGLHP